MLTNNCVKMEILLYHFRETVTFQRHDSGKECPATRSPADMIGHRSSVQNSVMVPYSMLIWLKKSTVLTATHSFRSSPSGRITARRRLPDNGQS